MTSKSNRVVVLMLLAVSMVLLIPGLFLPVLTIRGVLTRDGIAQVAPVMLEKGLSDETIAVLKSMMNPSILGFLNATGGDLRKIILEKLTPQVTAALQKGVDEVEVYTQTRSIVSAVRRLYEVGSPVPATLILLFSVIVPFGKAALVAWATFVAEGLTSTTHPEVRGDHCQVVDGRRLRRRDFHRLSRGEGEHRRSRRGPTARGFQRALRRRLLLVRRLLPLLAGVAADQRAIGEPRVTRIRTTRTSLSGDVECRIGGSCPHVTTAHTSCSGRKARVTVRWLSTRPCGSEADLV